MNRINSAQKGLIVFESKYGATQQYAEWIAGELVLPITTPAAVSAQQLQYADFLVIGTPVYNGVFRIKNWLKKQVKAVSGKKIFFFVVNATAPAEQAKRDQFVLNSIPPEIRPDCNVFFLPGRLIHSKLNFFDRLMLGAAAMLMKDPEKKKAIQGDIDGVKKGYTAALCNAITAFRGALPASVPASTEIQSVV